MKSKYTSYKGATAIEIDKLIDNYFKIIIKEVKKEIKEHNLISLILIGGFARGEGSICLNKNKIELLNDFDIFIITKYHLSLDLKKLSLDCLKKCNIKSQFSFKESKGIMQFYIDFRSMTLDELKKTPPFIKYYEMKNSAKVIYGRDVLKFVPNYNLSEIPLEEGIRHLFNRLSLLVEYLPLSYSKIGPRERRTAIFFIGKCYLSIAEALLLYTGDFSCNYKKRAEKFKRIYKKKFQNLFQIIPNLDKKILFHTNMKLKPKDLDIDIKKLWFEARNDTLKILEIYLNKIYTSKGYLSINDENFYNKLEKVLRKNLLKKYLIFYLRSRKLYIKNNLLLKIINYMAQWYLNLLFFRELLLIQKKRNLRLLFSTTDPGIKFYSALIPCIYALKRNMRIEKEVYKKALTKLKKIFPFKINNNDPFLSWKELCDHYTKAFRVFQFLKV